MKRTQVIVVGAGPVGVVAAYRLALAGIDVALLEEDSHCREDMRASTLHAPTLAMLASLGAFEALDQQGLRAPVYRYRSRRTGDVLAFDMGEIADDQKRRGYLKKQSMLASLELEAEIA